MQELGSYTVLEPHIPIQNFTGFEIVRHFLEEIRTTTRASHGGFPSEIRSQEGSGNLSDSSGWIHEVMKRAPASKGYLEVQDTVGNWLYVGL